MSEHDVSSQATTRPNQRAGLGPDQPENDVAEQRQDAVPSDAEGEGAAEEPPLNAPEADVAEQRQTVEFDEDEYR